MDTLDIRKLCKDDHIHRFSNKTWHNYDEIIQRERHIKKVKMVCMLMTFLLPAMIIYCFESHINSALCQNKYTRYFMTIDDALVDKYPTIFFMKYYRNNTHVCQKYPIRG